MNYPLVIKVLGYTLWVEAGCMVLPLLFLALLPRSSGAGAVCPMRAEQPGPIKNKRVVASAGAYLVAYLLLLLVGAAVVAWGQNDFAEAFTISLACLSNIGPAMGSIGPVGDFSSLTEVSKLMMILWMLLGRLELMPILVMLSRGPGRNDKIRGKAHENRLHRYGGRETPAASAATSWTPGWRERPCCAGRWRPFRRRALTG